ncbi:tetratricopeptide repeat-containing sulfotransferase family protein [Thalassotalea euphylliae]|uniref:tetratricopeptide repeat-containing sulfotransferase family protein n=1 Tax=Thalassotalea euphylliae TaxID=1655234 RepID=UPI00363C7E6D
MAVQGLIEQAEKAHRDGQLDTAVDLYLQANNQSQTADAWFGLATIHMQQNELAKAEAFFENALAIERNALDINFNYLLCLRASNKFQDASERLYELSENVAKSDPMIVPYAQLAISLSAFDWVIQLSKHSRCTDPHFIFCVAQASMRLNLWQEAISNWQRLDKQLPNNPQILDGLSQSFASTLNFDTALAYFERYLSINTSENDLIRAADLALLAQDIPKATLYLEQISDQGTEAVLTLKCKLARLSNNKADAIRIANLLIKMRNDCSFAWQVIGELGDSVQLAQLRAKLPALVASATTTDFERQQNLYTLAKALEKNERFDEAFSRFKSANASQQQLFSLQGVTYSPPEEERQLKKIMAITSPSTGRRSEHTNNVFIVGMPRSGTTLVNRLLSQLPDSRSVNESNGIASCFHNLFSGNYTVEIAIEHLLSRKEEYVNGYRRYVNAKDEIIIDKMPHNFRFVGGILSSFDDAKVIQMRRQPSDLALSIFSQQFNHYHAYSTDLKHIAHAIWNANKLMDVWSKKFESNVLDVDYEELVSNPQKVCQQIFSFLGFTWSDKFLDFYKQSVSSFTFSEVQVRQPINRKKINFAAKYKKQLVEFEQEYQRLQR